MKALRTDARLIAAFWLLFCGIGVGIELGTGWAMITIGTVMFFGSVLLYRDQKLK